jgi:hypothetical protein
MPAMTFLSWFSAVATHLSLPCSVLTRSPRIRRGQSLDTRRDSHSSMLIQSCVAADVLATSTEITGPRASDLSHGCVKPVAVRVKT